MSRIAKTIAICCLFGGAPAFSQVAERPNPQPAQAADPMADVARLYDSLDARPGWPTTESEAEVDAGLARRGLNPEQRRAVIGLMRQDVCRVPAMVPVCRYYGAETIYKVQRLAWARRGASPGRPGPDRGNDNIAQQMRLLEYGASRNLARMYGETGLSEAREAELNNTGPAGRSAAALGFSSQLSLWFACSADEQSLPLLQTGTWPRYRLTTCGTGFGWYWQIVIFKWEFSVETVFLASHSRFARKVLGFWWLTGSEPTICANSIIDYSGNLACNSYRWYSPVSLNIKIKLNSGQMPVYSTGSGARLGYQFGVSIQHQ